MRVRVKSGIGAQPIHAVRRTPDVAASVSRSQPIPAVASRSAAHSLLALQRQYGNHHVQRVLDVARKVEDQATAPGKAAKKDEPVDEFTRNMVNGQEDLRLVFYDSEAAEAKFFGIQASMIAASINAVRIPAACPAKRAHMKLAVGANPFNDGNILPVLRKATRCTGRKVSEIQVVGHLHTGVRFADAAKYAPHVEQGIRLVFHGCSVLRFYPTDLRRLLKHFGSEAEIFAHNVSGEAGRPYEFWRVTLPAEKSKIETELLQEVTFILPKSYIQKWTAMQSSARLYGLLRAKETEEQDDAKLVIQEELSKRLATTVRAWSKKRLENRLKRLLYDWEKAVLESELARKAAPVPKPGMR